MGLEIESMEKVLWMMSEVGPLPKLNLLEAESDSLVQMRLKIYSFCNEIKQTEGKIEKKRNERIIAKLHVILIFFLVD
jgi:hypothetical protein